LNYKGTPCANCSSTSTLTVKMPSSKSARMLAMTSCLQCEHRSWRSDDADVTVPNVLREFSGRVDFALTPTARPQRRATRKQTCAT
jgi:hypothetical protein